MSARYTVVRGRIGPGLPGTIVFEVAARRTASGPVVSVRYVMSRLALQLAGDPKAVRRDAMRQLSRLLDQRLGEMP